VCRSTDPRDRRTRTAAVIEVGDRRLLIDTPPELRLQLLDAKISRIDAVLYTHEHADHINGIDDLRIFTAPNRVPLTVHGPVETLERLRTSFNYIFDATVQPYAGTSKPELVPSPLEPGRVATIAGLDVLPLAFNHGHVRVFGYRVGPVAYITDVKGVPDDARRALRGVEVLVLNALWRRPHPTHLSIDEAVEAAQAIGAPRTYLTHLTHETGHAELAASLPAGNEPAYDGLIVEAS
jgi:phosphoribosyl 1,2-cyclic phosphate phosphodiesterase